MERKSKFDFESPSFLFPIVLERRLDLREIYISKTERCQPCSSKLFSSHDFSLTLNTIFNIFDPPKKRVPLI